MVNRLTKTPKNRLEAARADCLRFGRAIVARWPRRMSGYYHAPTGESSVFDQFAECLPVLSDRDLIAQFLSALAEKDSLQRLGSLVVSACREFGWTAFNHELTQLLAASPHDRFGPEDTPVRDLEWVCDVCCEQTAAPDRAALSGDCFKLLMERFCKPRAARPTYLYRERSTISDKALTLLVKASAAGGRGDDLSRVVEFIQGLPKEFLFDDCVVPALKSLIPWSRKRFGEVPPPLASWLEAVCQQLETATASEPAPPINWARPADVDCTCKYCGELKQFLGDPAAEIGRIAAREDMRQHLIDKIDRHRCDVKHRLERRGSPFSLVLTKTSGSFHRAVKRFEADVRLLDELPHVSN